MAMVGSRRATAYGRQVAQKPCSGASRGSASRSSPGARAGSIHGLTAGLEAGGRTAAVLGCGFGHIYPPENKELFAAIAASGAVVSEFPIETPPLGGKLSEAQQADQRALAAGTIVVEATRKVRLAHHRRPLAGAGTRGHGGPRPDHFGAVARVSPAHPAGR